MFTDEPMDIVDAVRPEDDDSSYTLEDLAKMCGDEWDMTVEHRSVGTMIEIWNNQSKYSGGWFRSFQDCVKEAIEFLKEEGE